MFIFTALWGIVTSVFSSSIGKTVLTDVIDAINGSPVGQDQKDQLISEVTVNYLNAQVQMAATRATAFGKWSVLMALMFLIGPAIWWNATFIVSTWPSLFPDYKVLALPSDFYPWMTSIISAVFFIPTINTAVNKIGGGGVASLFSTKRERILSFPDKEDHN